MANTKPQFSELPPVRIAVLPGAETVNRALLSAFERESVAEAVHRTHHFHGRFENTYIDRQRLPELDPVIGFALVVLLLFVGLSWLVGRWDSMFSRVSPNRFVQDMLRSGVRIALTVSE